jgi:hypothetical protein
MPYDTDGSLYRSLINQACLRVKSTAGLMPILSHFAKLLGADSTTESTVAVGYWQNRVYVAKLGRKTEPVGMVDDLTAMLTAPMDVLSERFFKPIEDGGQFPIADIFGVGGGETGFHAEMMLIQEYNRQFNTVSAWGNENLGGIYIAASQGACPGCAGFMNRKQINHTGVRPNGRVSSRWINPIDATVCGSEIGLGLRFGDIQVADPYKWGV